MTMMRWIMLASAAGALFASPASAQTQAQFNAEAADTYALADESMASEWRTTYAAMKARDRASGGRFGYAAATLASQRAWLAFRDAQCAAEGNRYAGGSMQPMAVAQCRAGLTNQRTVQLRWMQRAR